MEKIENFEKFVKSKVELGQELAKPMAKLQQAKAITDEAIQDFRNIMVKYGINVCRYHDDVYCESKLCTGCDLSGDVE